MAGVVLCYGDVVQKPDDDVKNDWDVVFVLLPQHVASAEAHSTLLALGKPDETALPATMLWNIGKAIAGSMPAPCGLVVGHEQLGEKRNFAVARLEGNDLYAARMMFDGLANSKWGYVPHITQQEDYPLPPVGTVLRFDRLGLWYGEERFAWRFGSGASCAAR